MKRDYTKKIRAKLAEAIIVAIIGAVALVATSVINYAASTYKDRHDDSQIEAGSTVKMKFGKSDGEIEQVFNLYPSSGTLSISAKQTKGKENGKNKYSFGYKKSEKKSYKIFTTFSFNYNKVFTRQHIAGEVKKGQKYDLKVSKIAGYDKGSELVVDWLVK